MSFAVEGAASFRQAASKIQALFSPAALTTVAVAIAAEAGIKLKDAIVQRCVEEIYELSGGAYAPFSPRALPGLAAALGAEYGGSPEERTEALMRAHEIVDEGLVQTVRVSPDADAEPTPHSGREKVIDYASHVHDGYTQWYMGHDTGVFHLGRPWFAEAVAEHGQEIVDYVVEAFKRAADEAFRLI